MISLYHLALIASCLAVTHATVCSSGEKNALNQLNPFLQCPRPFLDDPANEYCCLNANKNLDYHCCNALEFYLTYIIIAVVVFVVLSLVCSIVSCFCCPCCFFYKRRHAGNPI